MLIFDIESYLSTAQSKSKWEAEEKLLNWPDLVQSLLSILKFRFLGLKYCTGSLKKKNWFKLRIKKHENTEPETLAEMDPNRSLSYLRVIGPIF